MCTRVYAYLYDNNYRSKELAHTYTSVRMKFLNERRADILPVDL